MSFTPVGDQSRLFLNRIGQTRLKSDIDRLSQELSSGTRSRPATPMAGDTAQLLGLRRSRQLVESFRNATAEAATLTATAQLALGSVADSVAAIAPGLAATGDSGPAGLAASASDARQRLAGAIGALNTQIAGRAVLGGTATDRLPLADADTMLAALRSAVAGAGASTASDIAAVVDDWFDSAGGGFDSLAYQGDTGRQSLDIGTGERAVLDASAADAAPRAALKGLALAALSADAGVSAADGAQLQRRAGAVLVAAGDGLTQARAAIGAVEARIEDRTAGLAAEATALDLATARFTAADPYETATALEDASNRLQTLYAVTARLSRLSLTEYLR